MSLSTRCRLQGTPSASTSSPTRRAPYVRSLLLQLRSIAVTRAFLTGDERWAAVEPGIDPRPGPIRRFAKSCHWPDVPVLRDESELHTAPLAKKAATFSRMPCSALSLATSLRSRSFLSCSGFDCPRPGNACWLALSRVEIVNQPQRPQASRECRERSFTAPPSRKGYAGAARRHLLLRAMRRQPPDRARCSTAGLSKWRCRSRWCPPSGSP